MNALGYVRRSAKSEEKTISLDAQAELVQQYALRHGLELKGVLRHDGITGTKKKSETRLAAIEAEVERHQAKHLLVYHLDRFARDSSGSDDTLTRLTARGVVLHEVAGSGALDYKSATGKLTAKVRAVIDEHYADIIGEKTASALARKKALGKRYTNLPPFGYKYRDGLIIPHAEEQQALIVLANCKAQGLGARRAQKALREAGYRGRMGVATLHRLLHTVPPPTDADKLPAIYFSLAQ
jgi:DNA invertase Pin-like site-specific DNA recombinase